MLQLVPTVYMPAIERQSEGDLVGWHAHQDQGLLICAGRFESRVTTVMVISHDIDPVHGDNCVTGQLLPPRDGHGQRQTASKAMQQSFHELL